MIPPRQLIHAIIDSLRNVIGPAIAEPYPKSQAFMAAVILEFVARQIDERSDIAAGKHDAINGLLDELARMPTLKPFTAEKNHTDDAEVCSLIERLYAERETLGADAFAAANASVRAALRRMLDQDLIVVGKSEG